jgi:hypothetical protein
MNLKDQIKLLQSYESSKKNWRNVHTSNEWILADKVASIIMSQGLNKSKNCGCLDDLFIMLKTISQTKIELKMKQENNKFKLKPGILLFLGGTHYSNANITDEKSIEILTKFPTKIKDFETYPEDWEKLTGSDEPGTNPNPGTNANENADVVELKDMDAEALRSLCDELAANTEGLSKLHHATKDPQKMINYLLKNKVNG